ncbi:beta strand repeat-containing protein, partial [Patescibacteria group bacterium]
MTKLQTITSHKIITNYQLPITRRIKKCYRSSLIILLISLFIWPLGQLSVLAAPSQDNNAGTWTDTFSDETGLSASSDTGVSGGEIILDSTTPGAWTETALADFSQGEVSQTDIQTTSGSILLESGNYTESLGANGFSAVGSAQSWQADDVSYEYSLPFTFSYYGSNYSTIWVNTNGYVHLDSNYNDYIPTRTKIKQNKMIAPLWMDLVTNGSGQAGEDIYILENADNVVIRWVAESLLDEKPVNFSVQLYSSGTVKFHYGTGTGLAAASNYQREIGLSKGDQVSYLASGLDDDSDLSSAQTATETYSSGYLTPGTFTSQTFDGYDSTNNKTAVSIQLVTAALPASTSVKVEYSVNGGSSYATAGTYSTTSGTGTTYTGLSGSGTSLRYKLTLTGTSSVTPEVQSIAYNYTLSSSLVETASEDFIDGTLSNVDAGLTQDQVELSKTTVSETLTTNEAITEGDAQSFKADDESFLYNLPFTFSFYGTDYTSVYVNSNGYLVFDEDYSSFTATLANLKTYKIIAPLWADIRTNGSAQAGEDIYIQENASSVEIYWKAEFWDTEGTANFSAELFDTGKIEFHYGTGNASLDSITHIVGASKGDSSTYIQSDLSDDSNLTSAQTSNIDYTSARATTGTWTSPTYDAGLSNQDKAFTTLAWNKTTPGGTSISLQYDLDAAGSWSAADTSGSITFPANTTAKSIRFKANFTGNGTATSTLEDVTLAYHSYESSGTAITANIDPSVGPVEWETASFNSTAPDSTTLTVDVLDTSNNALLTGVDSGDSLTSIDVGTYTAVRLRANLSTTNQGLTPSLQDWTVNWDPRTPTVTQSTDFGSFGGSGNLSVAWSATDADTGTAGLVATPMDIFYSDDSGTNFYQIIDDIANSSPYAWDTSEAADDTDYQVKITAEDGYGVTGSDADPAADFTIDNYSGANPNAPSVSLTTPAAGVTWAGTKAITYSASDADSGDADLKANPINLFYSTDDTNWYLIAADQSNSGSYSWDTSTVTDGTSYKVKVRAFDGEGKVGEATSGTFSIDNTGPTFTVGYYSDSNLSTALLTSSGLSQAKAGLVYLKFTASESLQSAPTFGVNQPGSQDVSSQSTTLVSGNVYRGSYTVVAATGSTYIDGTATTSVSGTDGAGNTGTGITSGETFGIDTSAPSAPTIGSPTNNQVFLSTTETISVSGTAEANSTATVTVSGTSYTTTTSGGGTYSRGSVELAGGTQAVSVKATDAAGNDSSAASINVKLNRKPSVSISSPTSTSVFSGSGNSISWTATDADSDTMTYQVAYSSDGGSTWATLVDSQTGTSYSWDVSSLTEGSNYKVRIIASDGNETTTATSASFSVYSNRPTVSLSDIGTTNDTTPTFTGTAASTKTTIGTVKYRLGTSGDWSTATAT